MPKDKTETNTRIIRFMREEFLTYGYEKASLNRISAKAGITTAALYKHFKGKEDMFRYLVQDTLDDFRKLSSNGQSEMGIEAYDPFACDWAMIWMDFIYAHYEGMKLLICCAEGSSYASFEEDLIEMEARGNKAYAEEMQKAGKAAKPITDVQWHILSTAYVHLIFEAVRHDMTKAEAEEHARFVSELLYPGWKEIFGI